MTFENENPYDDQLAAGNQPSGPPAFSPSSDSSLPEVAPIEQQAPRPPGPQDMNAQPAPPSPQAAHAQQPGVPPAGYPQPTTVVAKNPGIAAFLSFIWPGAGHLYIGNIGLGIALICITFVNILLTFILIGFVTGFVTWIFAIFHSHSQAQAFNREHGIIS